MPILKLIGAGGINAGGILKQINKDKPSVSGEKRLYLGVDGGGSKCRVKISTGDQVLGEGLGGPANPLHGIEQCKDSIITAAKLALQQAGLKADDLARLIAGVGLAGANLPACHHAVKVWDHPFKQLFITTDLDIACIGAHQGGDGGVIIAGTGSSGYACVKGQKRYIGGHGFPHGDKGSGAWIGLQAIQHVLLVLDQLADSSLLFERLIQRLNCCDAISVIEYFMPLRSNRFATIAPLVFEAANSKDPIAVSIIKDAAGYLSLVAKRLLELNPPRLSVLGGLSDLITPWLDDDVFEHIVPAQTPPEDGAVLFAMQESSVLAKAM